MDGVRDVVSQVVVSCCAPVSLLAPLALLLLLSLLVSSLVFCGKKYCCLLDLSLNNSHVEKCRSSTPVTCAPGIHDRFRRLSATEPPSRLLPSTHLSFPPTTHLCLLSSSASSSSSFVSSSTIHILPPSPDATSARSRIVDLPRIHHPSIHPAPPNNPQKSCTIPSARRFDHQQHTRWLHKPPRLRDGWERWGLAQASNTEDDDQVRARRKPIAKGARLGACWADSVNCYIRTLSL